MPQMKIEKMHCDYAGNFRRGCPRHRLRRTLALLCLVAVLAAPLFAEHTRTWRQASYEDFLKGTAHGVAVRSDGRLELAPKFTLLSDADASYLLSLRVDPKGGLYAAGGSPAKVFRLDASQNSKPATVFESTDLVAQAIAFDAKGTLYVGTSPDGKVYRVSASGEKTVFFDPKAKYIWDLAFAADGTLYVATGDKGQIFAVAPDGKGELFYASDEAHIRVLAFDGHRELLAGTEPSGRILRVTRSKNKGSQGDTAAGEGFVLYETAKREVTALAVGKEGQIYAAAIGEKQHPSTPAPTTVVTTPQGTTTITGGAVVLGGQPQGQTPFIPFPQQLSSSIYRLSADGAPEELWNSRDDVVYALAINSDGRLLAGTGNSGALLAIDGRGVFAQLAKAGSAQITGIARDGGGKLFLCTANPGKVFSVGPEYEAEGTYESRSFDAQLFSQWGRLDWWSPTPASADKAAAAKSSSANAPRVEFFARSGNTEDPGKEWSRWFGPYSKPTAAECPAARFAQWRAVIHDGRSGDGISWVSLAYLPRNVAPVIDSIAVQDPGVRAQANIIIQTGLQPSVGLRQPQTSTPSGVVVTQSSSSVRFEQPPQGFREKGYQSVLWSAHDDNDDELRFSIYFRGENETEWKLLKDKLEQRFYSWDSTAMPDGAYYLKIVATDATSNPPAQALTSERESERLVVDNTAPSIDGLNVSWGSFQSGPNIIGRVPTIKFTARDATSSIDRAQYSIDGGDWITVSPKGGISDAPEEQYETTVNVLSSGEHTVAVRAYDRFDNVGSAKTTIKLR